MACCPFRVSFVLMCSPAGGVKKFPSTCLRSLHSSFEEAYCGTASPLGSLAGARAAGEPARVRAHHVSSACLRAHRGHGAAEELPDGSCLGQGALTWCTEAPRATVAYICRIITDSLQGGRATDFSSACQPVSLVHLMDNLFGPRHTSCSLHDPPQASFIRVLDLPDWRSSTFNIIRWIMNGNVWSKTSRLRVPA
ncbi:uncharacterized protein LOC142817848 [Rhipicephalus microplus]|uniref:uncharacterized protein LOC142817848 n=1 Tax=Rhipicephalus microplus TaxID=6941 RepID=UPI003F6D8120